MGVVIGLDPTKVRTSTEGPEFDLGTIAWEEDAPSLQSSAIGVTGGSGGTDQGPKAYMYVKAAAAGITGDGYVCIVNPATKVATMVTDTLSAPGAGQGFPLGVARAAIGANGYGWVQVFGVGTVRCLTLAAVGTQLTTSATSGTLDDATTAGLEVAEGITLTTAAGGGTENVAGFLNWPRVGRTL